MHFEFRNLLATRFLPCVLFAVAFISAPAVAGLYLWGELAFSGQTESARRLIETVGQSPDFWMSATLWSLLSAVLFALNCFWAEPVRP